MSNYQDSKRRFQKNNNRNSDRPTNYKVNIPVFYIEGAGSYTPNGIRFDIESLDDILASLNESNAFRLISHPINMKKSDVFTDAENARGNIAVGYIRNITNNGDIAVTINAKYVDAYKKIKEPTIQVNGIVKDGIMNTILSFFICEYSTLFNEYCGDIEEVEESDDSVTE